MAVSWALNLILSLCEGQSRPRTWTPRRAASQSRSPIVGLASVSRSSESLRQSVTKIRSASPRGIHNFEVTCEVVGAVHVRGHSNSGEWFEAGAGLSSRCPTANCKTCRRG